MHCTVKMRVSILRQIISGLAFLHKFSYVHRDINVSGSEESVVILCDVVVICSQRIFRFASLTKVSSRSRSAIYRKQSSCPHRTLYSIIPSVPWVTLVS
jgi:serine/threonine protein kinase